MTLPPGPELSPIVCTWHWFRRPLPFLEETRGRYGDTFTMQFVGLGPLVVFSDPESVREIFADDGETMMAGRTNRALAAFLGAESVLMADGAVHRRKRRLLMPPLQGERMQAYGRTMVSMTDDAVEAWPRAEPFRLHPELQRITLRVIVRTIFGVEASARFDALVAQIAEVLDLASWPPLLIPQMRVDLGPLSPWGRVRRRVAAMDEFLYAEIANRRREGTAGRTDILSLLLDAKDESGQPMAAEELRDELVTLLVAGHETTATSLAWALQRILEHPEVHRRLADEIAGDPTPERVMKLEYLDAVCRETMRLNPVIPMVARQLARPARVGEIALRAGDIAACSIYLAHRRPQAYPEPTRFLPERFLGKRFTPSEFFPFGGGVRRCIGMAFALYEMKIVLATILARGSLSLAAGPPVRAVRRSVTLAPSGGVRVMLRDRPARAA